jgi:hypothetical protein
MQLMILGDRKYPVKFMIDSNFPKMLMEYNKIILICNHPNNKSEHMRVILRMIDQFQTKWSQIQNIEYFAGVLLEEYSRCNSLKIS